MQQNGSTHKASRFDEALLAALLAGFTQEQAASRAGCSRSTVERRLADPGFRARLADAREQLFRQGVGELITDMAAVRRRLTQHVADPDPEVSLKACNVFYTHLLKAREQGELAASAAELMAQARAFAGQCPAPFPGRG
jgi:hypothetical protein